MQDHRSAVPWTETIKFQWQNLIDLQPCSLNQLKFRCSTILRVDIFTSVLPIQLWHLGTSGFVYLRTFNLAILICQNSDIKMAHILTELQCCKATKFGMPFNFADLAWGLEMGPCRESIPALKDSNYFEFSVQVRDKGIRIEATMLESKFNYSQPNWNRMCRNRPISGGDRN